MQRCEQCDRRDVLPLGPRIRARRSTVWAAVWSLVFAGALLVALGRGQSHRLIVRALLPEAAVAAVTMAVTLYVISRGALHASHVSNKRRLLLVTAGKVAAVQVIGLLLMLGVLPRLIP